MDDVRSWSSEGYALRCLALAFFNRARCATRTAFFSFCGHIQWLSAKKAQIALQRLLFALWNCSSPGFCGPDGDFPAVHGLMSAPKLIRQPRKGGFKIT